MATITPDEFLQIHKIIAERCGEVAECGYIVPAPVYFNDKEDFQAQIASVALITQKGIETAEIAFCAVRFLRFEDLDTEAAETDLFFELYLFRQYGLERLDETETPDEFLKRMLKSYHLFVSGIAGLRAAFAGENPITGLDPARFAEALTESLTQDDFISEGNEECKYIPRVRGFAAELTVPVKIMMTEC